MRYLSNETSTPICWFKVASIRCFGPVPIESPFFQPIGGNHPRQPKNQRRSRRDYSMFENRGPKCALLVYIDDATGKLLHLRFATSENTFDYLHATKAYLQQWGKPIAFYSDKHGIFRTTHASKKDQWPDAVRAGSL